MRQPTPREQAREDARFRILDLLEQQPELSQRELAEALGVSLGAVNYTLRALAEKGFIKLRNFRASERKLGYAYVLTPAGMSEKSRLAGRFIHRKLREYDALREELDALSNRYGALEQDAR